LPARRAAGFWGKAEMDRWGKSAELVANDPDVWSGRAMQGDFDETVASGLESIYPAFDWSVVLRAHHQRAAAFSLADRP